jgi:2-C-methyl-D-erythritol 4-phosphate cytidylyltransferase
VRRGLESLEPSQPDCVLIHDAARPFVPVGVIEAVIAALRQSDGSCAALPLVDALWKSENNNAQRPVAREGLWRAQTPQGFRFEKILEAHRCHDGLGADDVTVAREVGMDVKLVLGSEQNYKITTADDLERAISDARRLSKAQMAAPVAKLRVQQG